MMPLGATEAGDLADLDAETKESETDFDSETVDSNRLANLNDETEGSPLQVVLRYSQSTPKTLVDHFPREKLSKGVSEHIILERSKTTDVLLNDTRFGRKHAVLGCRQQDDGTISVIIKNTSKNKHIVVVKDNKKVSVIPDQEAELNNGVTLKMEMLEFVIEIEPGDYNAKCFEFQILPQDEPNSRIPVAQPNPKNTKIEHRCHGMKTNSPGIVHGVQMGFPEMTPACVRQNFPIMSPTMPLMTNGERCGPSMNLQSFGSSGAFVVNCNPLYGTPVPPASFVPYQNPGFRFPPSIPTNQGGLPPVGQIYNVSVINCPTSEDTNPVLVPSASNYAYAVPVGAVGTSPHNALQRPGIHVPFTAASQNPDDNIADGAASQTTGANNFVTTHAIKESNQNEPRQSAVENESQDMSCGIVSPESGSSEGVEMQSPSK